MLLGQELHDAVLGAVGVLVLVDQHVASTRVRYQRSASGHRLEQAHHPEQQVVEVERARGLRASAS